VTYCCTGSSTPYEDLCREALTWCGGTCRLLADLQSCLLIASRNERPDAEPARAASWSLRERLSDDVIEAMGCAYRAGVTASELAVTHDLSLSSVKRLLRATKVRKRETAQ
jgi:hypothetical protein